MTIIRGDMLNIDGPRPQESEERRPTAGAGILPALDGNAGGKSTVEVQKGKRGGKLPKHVLLPGIPVGNTLITRQPTPPGSQQDFDRLRDEAHIPEEEEDVASIDEVLVDGERVDLAPAPMEVGGPRQNPLLLDGEFVDLRPAGIPTVDEMFDAENEKE